MAVIIDDAMTDDSRVEELEKRRAHIEVWVREGTLTYQIRRLAKTTREIIFGLTAVIGQSQARL